jgi:hypothetical protein
MPQAFGLYGTSRGLVPGVWTFSELTGVEKQGDKCLSGGMGQWMEGQVQSAVVGKAWRLAVVSLVKENFARTKRLK